MEETLARFGQAVVRVDKLLAVVYVPAAGAVGAHARLVFEGGTEVEVDAAAGQALVEAYPDRAEAASPDVGLVAGGVWQTSLRG